MKFHIHDSFWMLLAVMIFIDAEKTLPAFLIAAAVHELGHWAAVRLCGGTITKFEISAAGGFMQYHLHRLSWRADLWIALCGPIFGFILAYIAKIAHYDLLAGASLLLSVFNLLPIGPLDGGRALESVLYPGHPILNLCGFLFSFLIILLGTYTGLRHNGWGLCLIGVLLLMEQGIGLQSLRFQGKI